MRRLTTLGMILGVSWLGLWGLASLAVPRLADAFLAKTIPKVERAGIAVDSLTYGDIRVSPSLTGATAEDFSAAFDLTPTDKITLRSTFEAHEMTVRVANPLTMRGHLSAENFELAFHETDRPERLPFDRLTNGFIYIHDLPLLSPRKAIVEIFDGLEELFIENARVGDFEFSGDVMVRVHDLTFPALLYTERRDKQFRLRFSKPDIERLAEAADVDLSDEQIDIVSLYPIRLPSLMEITRQARRFSKEFYPSNAWHRDALRHVSWSFLLTREFGPEFAKEVTDAQETKPGNTPNERAMDYHNNAVGRRFAAEGTELTQLPLLVQSHADVIRHPDEVDTRLDLLR